VYITEALAKCKGKIAKEKNNKIKQLLPLTSITSNISYSTKPT